MKKTLMIAAALLTLGAGSAFAEGYAEVLPAQVSNATAASSANHLTAFATSTQRPTTSVYGLFGQASGPQGGQQ
ncbi:MAG: hypothetical protein P4L71_06815 [Acetobacteraceae bacterium]|nr:hypothetical protein [Acetobacteraceae bacterium]